MKKLFLFAAACVALVACNNKDNAVNGDQPKEPGRQVTITATVDFGKGSNAPIRTVAPDTPIPTTDGATVDFHWEKGDQILLMSYDASENQLFTVVDNSIQGNSANFTGTALTDMTGYFVFYAGKNISEDFALSVLKGEPIVLTNATNNYNILAIATEGDESGFTLNLLSNTLRLPLTGSGITLGSIKCYSSVSPETPESILNFDGGLALSSTAQEIWFPYPSSGGTSIIFRFYDTDGELIMEKSQTMDWTKIGVNELITFPELEVKKPSPKDVFKAGSTFQITIFADEEHYNIFKYKYNSDQTFTCTYINVDGTDGTSVYASYCPCVKGDGNTFTFTFATAGTLVYNADATPATAVMRPGKYESEYLSYTLTNFQVNDVDILDQITVSKQPE